MLHAGGVNLMGSFELFTYCFDQRQRFVLKHFLLLLEIKLN